MGNMLLVAHSNTSLVPRTDIPLGDDLAAATTPVNSMGVAILQVSEHPATTELTGEAEQVACKVEFTRIFRVITRSL